jgi:hypothetical protein
MKWHLGVLLALGLLAACAGAPPRPAVTAPAPTDGAPAVTIGGNVRGYYGHTR